MHAWVLLNKVVIVYSELIDLVAVVRKDVGAVDGREYPGDLGLEGRHPEDEEERATH